MKSFPAPKNGAALRKLSREWQKRLRLQDWDIRTTFATKEDKIDDAFGRSIVASGHKAVNVFINPTPLIDDDWIGCRDIEVTLVHELLHLHGDTFDHFFSGSKKNSRPTEYLGLEFFIEITAIVLVELKRGVPREQWA
jgi:hypothetical protein